MHKQISVQQDCQNIQSFTFHIIKSSQEISSCELLCFDCPSDINHRSTVETEQNQKMAILRHLRNALVSTVGLSLIYINYSTDNNATPILSTKRTTSAFPIQKYRIFSGIPVSVQLLGNPFNRSHSIGVSTRNRPVRISLTT